MFPGDLTRRALRRRMATAATFAVLVPLVASCGDDENQTAAPAQTGQSEPGELTTATEPGSMPDEEGQSPDPNGQNADSIDNEAAIVATMESVLAGDDPRKACSESVTERFLRRAYGDASGCEAAQAGAKPADDARVTQVVIAPGSVAQALARPKGGIYDGQKLRAELILDDEVWKLDSLRSNVPVGP